MPAWIHSDPNADDGYYQDQHVRECARAHRCTAPRFEQVGEKTVKLPALTPRPFCDADRDVIVRTLEDLPNRWRLIHAEIGNLKASNGDPVSGSRSAPLPLSLDVDELLRLTLSLLVSWEERVRPVARLAELDSRLSRLRRDEVALEQACRVLADWVDVLLSLESAPMLRVVSISEAAELPAGTPGTVRPFAGYAEVMRELDGTDAGEELLYLHWRCRAALTDVGASARHLPVPCRCGFTELYELLDWDERPDGARCRECGVIYTDNEFTLLRAERYAVAEVRKASMAATSKPPADYGLLSGRA